MSTTNTKNLVQLKPSDLFLVTKSDIVYSQSANGKYHAWRVTSIKKDWKRDPDRVEIGLKHGLRHCYKLTNINCVGSNMFWEAL